MRVILRTFALLLLMVLAGGIGGCAEQERSLVVSAVPADERPSDEPIVEGRKQYALGHYGLAEKNFQTAVEANPKSGPAWLGLAASYDRLRRFDLADRAYTRTRQILGDTPAVLNNLGYHYLLQGDVARARSNFEAAAKLAPGDPRIQGNLTLAANWRKGERPEGYRDPDLLRQQ